MMAWADAVSPYAVDVATFGLAALGGYVAVRPPEKGAVRLKGFYVLCFAALALAGIIFSTHERNRSKRESIESEKRFDNDLGLVASQNNSILDFLAHPPKNLTKEEVGAIVSEWAKALLDRPKIPPINNNELRQEVLTYTRKLRDMDTRLSALWSANMLKPINLQPGQEARTRAWVDGERTIESDFHREDLGRGIHLRDELRKRLSQGGTPPPNALNGEPFSAPEQTHPLDRLASYLDGLANQLPYP
jgi:hypothetical protein